MLSRLWLYKTAGMKNKNFCTNWAGQSYFSSQTAWADRNSAVSSGEVAKFILHFAVDFIYQVKLSVLYPDSVFRCCSYPMSRWRATLCLFVQAKFGEFVQCAMRAMAVMCWKGLCLRLGLWTGEMRGESWLDTKAVCPTVWGHSSPAFYSEFPPLRCSSPPFSTHHRPTLWGRNLANQALGCHARAGKWQQQLTYIGFFSRCTTAIFKLVLKISGSEHVDNQRQSWLSIRKPTCHCCVVCVTTIAVAAREMRIVFSRRANYEPLSN